MIILTFFCVNCDIHIFTMQKYNHFFRKNPIFLPNFPEKYFFVTSDL